MNRQEGEEGMKNKWQSAKNYGYIMGTQRFIMLLSTFMCLKFSTIESLLMQLSKTNLKTVIVINK